MSSFTAFIFCQAANSRMTSSIFAVTFLHTFPCDMQCNEEKDFWNTLYALSKDRGIILMQSHSLTNCHKNKVYEDINIVI